MKEIGLYRQGETNSQTNNNQNSTDNNIRNYFGSSQWFMLECDLSSRNVSITAYPITARVWLLAAQRGLELFIWFRHFIALYVFQLLRSQGAWVADGSGVLEASGVHDFGSQRCPGFCRPGAIFGSLRENRRTGNQKKLKSKCRFLVVFARTGEPETKNNKNPNVVFW